MARSELARVAERAWQEGMDKGRDFKDIMQDVAEAVANAIDDSLERVGGYYAHGKPLADAECAVIEAAKAFHRLWKQDKGGAHFAFCEFVAAVEALEEVESD